MPTLVYRPNDLRSNQRGFLPKELAYEYDPNKDLRAVIGNQVVELSFISDNMEPTRHMCDGKYYTSKKKFRNETKARGCVEIGNETSTLLKPKKYIAPSTRRQRREDIKKAIYELKNK